MLRLKIRSNETHIYVLELIYPSKNKQLKCGITKNLNSTLNLLIFAK